MSKVWYSVFTDNEYKGNEPFFLDPAGVEFSKLFGDKADLIRGELLGFLEKKQLHSYFNAAMVNTANTWKTTSLKTWGVNIYKNYQYFPETVKVISSVPGLVSASFNLLEPKGHIVPHKGDTNAILRCHLGLVVPGTIPACGFRVGNEWRSWEEGKLLIFVDANNHEAINNTDHNRYILSFDVIRKEFQGKKRLVCATVLSSLTLQKIAGKIGKFVFGIIFLIKGKKQNSPVENRKKTSKATSKVPIPLKYILVWMLTIFILFAVPVRNFLYKYK